MVYLVYFLCNFYLFRLFEVVFMKVIILVFGVNGTGTIPVFAVLIITPVLAVIGYFLVRRTMARNHLIKV